MNALKLLTIFTLFTFSFLEAKSIEIKPKVIKLTKQSIKNKNIHYFWNAKEKKLHIKRGSREIQALNFGVKPNGISLIDVNFDGYADTVLNIHEGNSGEYQKDGEYTHYFYYIYDKNKKRFVYHKELTSLIYATQKIRQEDREYASRFERRQAREYDELRGFAFNAKKKVLFIADAGFSFYGAKTYMFNNRKLQLKEQGIRLLPSHYPDGVDTKYIYDKDEKLSLIEVYKDGSSKTRENFKIVVKPKEETTKVENMKLPKENEKLEKELLNALHNLFINHQIEAFYDKYFMRNYKLNLEKANLMYVSVMLDNIFKREGKRAKSKTFFELIKKFSEIRSFEVEDFHYDNEKGYYFLDVKLQMKKGAERYRWHLSKRGEALYFLPMSYDEKNKINIILNENIHFDYDAYGLRIMNSKDSFGVVTSNGLASEECSRKYIEFRLYDYTGNGVLDLFQTCSRSLNLNSKEVKKFYLKYGTNHYFSMMIPQSANQYSWHEKKRRFVFAQTMKDKGHYVICNIYKNSKNEPCYKCDKTYWQETGKNYNHLITDNVSYIDKKLFEESIYDDELNLEDARDKAKKGAKLYDERDDVLINKVKYKLDEDEYLLIVDNTPISLWDRNISTSKPAYKMIDVFYKQRIFWMNIEELKKK